jgi:hypothetical protein
MKSPLWLCKKLEIECHLKKLFFHYGESMEYYDEYLNDVLQKDIDEALECFRSLVRHLNYLPEPKRKEDVQKLQGLQYRPPFA